MFKAIVQGPAAFLATIFQGDSSPLRRQATMIASYWAQTCVRRRARGTAAWSDCLMQKSRLAVESLKTTSAACKMKACRWKLSFYHVAMSATDSQAIPEHSSASKTALVVDDEEMLRMIITTVLEDLGYSPLEAEDGPSAMAILQSDTPIDLLITDINLPGGMNGWQIAEGARQVRPDLGVLFVTADGALLGREKLQAGMGILPKPFSLDVLTQCIEELSA